MSSTLEGLARRIDELENQVAFQDELAESLNDVVARQELDLIELKRQVGLMSERLKEIGDAAPGTAAQDETPPHY